MKRLFSLILALVFILGCALALPSCKQEDTVDDPPVNIIENGVAKYAVAYSSSCSEAVFTAVNDMLTGISQATGVTLELVRDTAAAEKGGRYILIGDTAFPESAAVKKTLANTADSFAVELADTGNVVVVSNYDDYIIDAVAYYIDELLPQGYSNDTRTLSFKGVFYDGTDHLPDGFDLANIGECRIIYTTKLAGFEDVALELQAAIKSAYGEELPVYSDRTTSAAREILVGNTNRSLSESCYEDTAYIMEYEVVAHRGSLQIACGGMFSAEKVMDELKETLFSENAEDTFLDAGRYVYADLAGEEVPITDVANVRIMTLNIMPYVLGEKVYPNIRPVIERVEIFAGMLIKHTPDVVGLQEADSKWQSQIPVYIDLLNEYYDLGYKYVLGSYKSKDNYCSMIYRADKYDALVCKYEPYEYDIEAAERRGSYIRGASQLVLQNKKHEDELFIVVNSHWDHGGPIATANPELMNNCARAEEAIVKAYKNEYPEARIFCVGDYNSHRFSGKFLEQFCGAIDGSIASEVARDRKTLIATGGYHANDATKILEDKNREYSSTHKNDFIDHIVFTGGSKAGDTDVVRHDTLYRQENYGHILSDHCAVYADFSFISK